MSHIKHLNQARSATQRWARAALVTAPLLAFAMLTAAPAANADGYRSGHHSGYNNRGYNRGYNRHHNRRYQRGYRGYRHSSHRRSDHHGAYLIGGLVVGSLITHAIINNQSDYRQERHTSQAYDRNKSYSTYSTGRNSEAPVSRRLFRDAQGNCFERQTGPDNQELLIDLPAEECRW
jgi:hypothetical protein